MFDDERFDVEAVAAGAWAPSRYGPDDVLGTYNEVTDRKRAEALGMIDLTRPVRTFSMGDGIWPGYPAFGDRRFSQTLVVAGYDPGEGFEGELPRGREPLGPSKLGYTEERVAYTFNMSSKINGFTHAAVDGTFYNGHRGAELAGTEGVTAMDVSSWGSPLLTRGLMIDIAAQVAATSGNVEINRAGLPRLVDSHRITVEQIEGACDRQGLPAPSPGDALCLRTGWISLTREDPERFLAGSPGPWIAENKWLASHRPALVSTDSWMWGVLDVEATGGWMSAGHQIMLVKEGIRMAESLSCEEIAAAGVDRFVFCHSPFRARGSTSCSSPPMAIANPPEVLT
ncbi:cyclase family protein [Candidatus Poriferisocius sp.]|uniref:cyclase family protein n=1 Tax=Candidatus Poriferisocius sp. TaxID=3101276 RepID=UPI003B025706